MVDSLRMFYRTKSVLLFIFFAAAFSSGAESTFEFSATPGQLPKTIVPHHYHINLHPDLDHLTTEGSVTIDLEVLKPTREIVLNALDLKVNRAMLHGGIDQQLIPIQDSRKQTVKFSATHRLPIGKYQLELEFEGKIGEQAQGLFYVKYPGPDGSKIMLGTQMEPSDARRMFPCWDEPVFRATFDLNVTLPEKFKGFSNLPIEHEARLGNGLKEIKFGRTPPMSSYLVVLVAGELEYLSDEAEGVKIRVVTTAGKQEQGRYALEATKKLLAYYNDYFGIKYPLPKLDQIAIPGGFDGAMENWGGITYNESVLLYDTNSSSLQTQREIFVTIAHEMSHQWFGNLVTTAWWDNLWLNEGFATWMETKATDHFNPSWQMQLSANQEKAGVMSTDARSTTHPIQDKVHNESEANDAFDSITYQKGGAFLRMLEAYISPDIFRLGVQKYLSAHAYSNTTTADLWQALEQVSHQPIRAISAGWTEQPGLPLVAVKSDCIAGKTVMTLKQERFTVQDPHPKPLRWKIPIIFLQSTNLMSNHLLLEQRPVSITLPHCDELLKLNAGDTGYYHVVYDPPLFEKLKCHLVELPPADQLNLLNDSWALVEANRLSPTNCFAMIESLRYGNNETIWSEIISLLELFDHLEESGNRAAWQSYAQRLLNVPFSKLGWERKSNEPVTDSLLRNRIIAAMGHLGDPTIIAEAKKRFESFVQDRSSLGPDLKSAVVQIAGRYADQAIYQQLHQLALKAESTEERQLFYSALSGALDSKLAGQTLALSLTEESVPQEMTALVTGVANHGEHPDFAWQFVKTHLNPLLAKVDNFARNEYIPSIFNAFTDTARADELESFEKKKMSADAFAKAEIAAQEIRFKASLKKRLIPVLNEWIKNKNHEN